MSDYNKSALTEVERAAIKQFHRDGVSVSEINEKLNRSPNSTVVSKIVEELDAEKETVLESVGPLIMEAMEALTKKGIQEQNAQDMIEKALEKIDKDNPPSLETFLSFCLSNKKTNLFGGKQIGNARALTQTEAASYNTTIREPQQSRKAEGAIFRPNG